MLSKKNLIVLGIILLVLVLVGGVFWFIQNQETQEISSPLGPKGLESSSGQSAGTETAEKYQDEAGFSFDYSESLSVKEVANQDETTYSALEIFSTYYPEEKMTILVKDTNFKNTEEWLLKNKQLGWVTNEAVVSQMNGKFITTPDKMMTVAIKDGIVFTIETPVAHKEYWEKQHRIVADSFMVVWPEAAKPAAGSSQTVVFEEEVIE